MIVTTNGAGPITVIPTSPRALATDARFPQRFLYQLLVEQAGEDDGNAIWEAAHLARGTRSEVTS